MCSECTMTSAKKSQLDAIAVLLGQLAQKATSQGDEALYPLISCACGARYALESIDESLWEKLQFGYTKEMILEMVKGKMSKEWIEGFRLNNANARTDALRDRMEEYLYKETGRKWVLPPKEKRPAFLASNPAIGLVHDDANSFKHFEYGKDAKETDAKQPASNRKSSPQNTSEALVFLLELIDDPTKYTSTPEFKPYLKPINS